MLTPFLIAAGIFATLLLILILFIATRPSEFTIRRSTTIAAPASTPYALIIDFHKWPSWSPWEKLDPAMKHTYEGTPSGPGAITSWVGNKKAGEGRMTMLDCRPGELITIKLEFLKPFAATNTAEFAFKSEGGGTSVVWSMHGTRNFMFKAFGLLMNMDKLVGGDFEKGLAAIKFLSEQKA